MDATGKVIRKQLANTNEIDILGLPAGLYILDFKGEKQEHYYLRFVKQ
jgi:hypothetical protein